MTAVDKLVDDKNLIYTLYVFWQFGPYFFEVCTAMNEISNEIPQWILRTVNDCTISNSPFKLFTTITQFNDAEVS